VRALGPSSSKFGLKYVLSIHVAPFASTDAVVAGALVAGASVTGASVAGASVAGASVAGASVAGASVAGASVAGASVAPIGRPQPGLGLLVPFV